MYVVCIYYIYIHVCFFLGCPVALQSFFLMPFLHWPEPWGLDFSGPLVRWVSESLQGIPSPFVWTMWQEQGGNWQNAMQFHEKALETLGSCKRFPLEWLEGFFPSKCMWAMFFQLQQSTLSKSTHSSLFLPQKKTSPQISTWGPFILLFHTLVI